MTKKLLSLTAIFLCFTLLFGCSDNDDSSSGGGNNNQLPSVGVQTITVPSAMKNSSNSYAQMAVGYINLANGFSAYTAGLTPPGNATVKTVSSTGLGMLEVATTTKTYTWTYSGLTYKLIFEETATNYSWTVIYDGTLGSGQGSITFNNQTILTATQLKDGSGGNLVVYYDTAHPTTATLEYVWTKIAGVYTGTITIGVAKYEVVVNTNGSGHITFWSDTALHYVFYATWTAAGSGTWTTYQTNGTSTGSGTW
ncbi:MAG: hypothetical protein HGB19_06680 [Chlorobiales bacterium]|jgi:hypothetical protein|nr:hypothetical protein [Chlorobiales bacterium]